MRYFSTLAAAVLLSSSMMAVTNIGYTSEKVSKDKVFRVTSNADQRLAMRLSKEKLQLLKGKTIGGIRVAFGSKNSNNNEVTFFITKSLDGEPVLTQTETITAAYKFVEYILSTPYVITGEEEELYIGYQMSISSSYSPMTGDFQQDIPGVSFAYGTNGWQDLYGKGYGAPNIQAIMNEDIDFSDVTLKSSLNGDYLKENVPLEYKLELFNFGTSDIRSFDVFAQISDEEEKIISCTDCNIPSHGTYQVSMPDFCAQTAGKHDIRIDIRNINGGSDADETDNTVSQQAYFYPSETEKNVLVEVFTSQTCTKCPLGHSSLESALEATGVNVVEVAHHSGYYTDIFTMKEDLTLTSLYNGSTYAPAGMFDRSILDNQSNPVYEITSISEDKTHLLQSAQQKPYVSIALDTKYDPATRDVKVVSQFYTHEQMPGEDLRYTVWLIQDGIVASQESGGTDYVHNAVSRGSITEGAWGESAAFVPGKVLTKELTFNLPEVISSTSYKKEDGKNDIPTVLENMKVVVFVHQVGKTVAENRVFNAVEVAIGESAVQGGFKQEEEKNTRQMARQTWYGDTQGYEKADVATRTLDYIYDSNNRLIRKVEMAKDTRLENWQLIHYYLSHYDESGNLSMTNSLMYGQYDYGELGYKAANDTITYEYDQNGNLVKECHPLKQYVYEYDNTGNMVRKQTWNINSITGYAANDLVEEYLDFNQYGKPTKVVAASPTGKEWNEYVGTWEYDNSGNILSKKHYAVEGEVVGNLKYAEYWVYENGMLKEHLLPMVFDDGVEMENEREVYEIVDGNKDRIKHVVYMYNGNGGWDMMAGTTCVDEYQEVNVENCPQMEIVPVESEINTVTISVAVSDLSSTPVTIYRSGLPVANVTAVDGLVQWQDTEVKNGTYEYIAVADGMASNMQTYTYNVELPSVTNVHAASVRKDLAGNAFVKIEWTNPAYDNRLGFKNNSLFYENMQIAETSTEDADANSFEVNFGSEKVMTLYIQSNYKYGRANSDAIVVDVDKVTGIEDIADTTNSDSTIYNLSGQRIIKPVKGLYIQGGMVKVK